MTCEAVVRRSNCLISMMIAASFGAGQAAAQTGAELMAEGNTLVRSGIYRTALLRYREAAAAGFDTPLLRYNMGVVHYELGDFDDAAAEFERAAADQALIALASYNRGLSLRAAGDAAGAAAAFRTAAENADDRDLARLAASAAAPAAEPERAPTRTGASFERSARVADDGIGEVVLAASARYGQDDNVFRAPAAAYADLSATAQPRVTPVVHSASFVPAELHAAYVIGNESGDTEFLFSYDMDGAFYDAEYSNATTVDQQLSMGADIVLGESDRRRRAVDTEFFASSHRETNYDPDNGLARDIDGESISDRFSYRASGVRGEFSHTLGRTTWGFDLRLERNEYARTEPVANFDHDYYYAGVDIGHELGDATTLRFGLRQYRTFFDERPARDSTGALVDGNPAQRYDYAGVQVGITRQLGSAVELEADVLRLDRTDAFVGYFDYSQDGLRLRALFRPTQRFDVALNAIARSYEYPNAFAFHVAAGGARELEERGVTVEAEYRITRRLTLAAALDAFDVTSTDARAAYQRTETTLGIEWRK